MSEKYVASLLSSVKGWKDGVRFSIADESNKKLEELLEKKQKAIFELQKSREDGIQRVVNLKKDLDNQTVVLTNNRKVSEHAQASLRHEKSLIHLAERHTDLLRNECKKSTKDLNDIESRRAKFTREYVKRKTFVENLTSSLQYNEETVSMLKDAAIEKDGELEFVQSLWKIDSEEVQKNEMKLKKLHGEKIKLQAELQSRLKETYIVEQQYEKQSREFRRVHNERNQAVERWKEVITALKKRDKALKDIAEAYLVHRAKVAKSCLKLEDRKNRILETSKGYAELEIAIEKMDVVVLEKQNILNSLKAVIENYKNANSNEKAIIIQNAGRIKHISEEINKKKAKIVEINELLESVTMEVTRLKEYAKIVKEDPNGTHSRMHEISQLLKEQESEYNQKEKELEQLRILAFQNSNILSQLKTDFKNVKYDINASRVNFKTLKNESKAVEVVLYKLKQEYYRLELRYMEIKERVTKLLVPEDREFQNSLDDNDEMRTVTLVELRKEIKIVTQQRKFLETQKAHILSIITKISQEISDSLLEKESLSTEAKTNCVITKNLENNRKLLVEQVKNAKVEASIFAFEKTKMLKLINESKRELLTLEQYKLHLKSEAEIRRAYIHSHKILLENLKRKLTQTRSTLIKNINEVFGVIKVWKIKYQQVFVGSAEENDSGYGEAYMILKHAQEKELIQREASMWEARIKEAETEVIGLRNNLTLATCTINSFKNTLIPAPDNSPELEVVRRLQLRNRELINKKKKAQTKLNELTDSYLNRAGTIDDLTAYGQTLRAKYISKDQEYNSLKKDILNQKAKIKRADLLSQRCIKCLTTLDDDKRKLFEAQMHLKAVGEKLNFAVNCLSRTLSKHEVLWKPTFDFLAKQPALSKVVNYLQQSVESKYSAQSKRQAKSVETFYQTHNLQFRESTYFPSDRRMKLSRLPDMNELKYRATAIKYTVHQMTSETKSAHERSMNVLQALAGNTSRKKMIDRKITIVDIIEEHHTRTRELQELTGAEKQKEINKRLDEIAETRLRTRRMSRRQTISDMKRKSSAK